MQKTAIGGGNEDRNGSHRGHQRQRHTKRIGACGAPGCDCDAVVKLSPRQVELMHLRMEGRILLVAGIVWRRCGCRYTYPCPPNHQCPTHGAKRPILPYDVYNPAVDAFQVLGWRRLWN